MSINAYRVEFYCEDGNEGRFYNVVAGSLEEVIELARKDLNKKKVFEWQSEYFSFKVFLIDDWSIVFDSSDLVLPGHRCLNCCESKPFKKDSVFFIPRQGKPGSISALCSDCERGLWGENEQIEQECSALDAGGQDEKKCADCGGYLWKVGGYDLDKDSSCHIAF